MAPHAVRVLRVLDMASLRFRPSADRTRLAVRLVGPTGALLLGTVELPAPLPDKEACTAGMDEVLATARLATLDPVSGEQVPAAVALLNPFTGQVSVGPLPTTARFALGTAELELAPNGSPALLLPALPEGEAPDEAEKAAVAAFATACATRTPPVAQWHRRKGALLLVAGDDELVVLPELTEFEFSDFAGILAAHSS